MIVSDEAHKMSATYFGSEIKYTKRYRLGQRLVQATRHFLLLTATGDAETFSKAKNTSVAGMVEAGLLKSGGGKVRLLQRSELKPEWEPAEDPRLTVWEVVQHLIRALDKQGETGAAALLARVPAGRGRSRPRPGLSPLCSMRAQRLGRRSPALQQFGRRLTGGSEVSAGDPADAAGPGAVDINRPGKIKWLKRKNNAHPANNTHPRPEKFGLIHPKN